VQLQLLAHCTALTIDAVHDPKRADAAQVAHADRLARCARSQ
jgi:hypothetical protein